MIRARTYEEPDEQGDHVLFTHPYTSLRMIDPHSIVYSSYKHMYSSDKHVAFCYPDLNLGGSLALRSVRVILTNDRYAPGCGCFFDDVTEAIKAIDAL